jgi:hypothetical protein
MTISFPPRKNAVFLGSRPLGNVLEEQGVVRPVKVLAISLGNIGRHHRGEHMPVEYNVRSQLRSRRGKRGEVLGPIEFSMEQVSEKSMSLLLQVVDRSTTKQDRLPMYRTLLDPRRYFALPS